MLREDPCKRLSRGIKFDNRDEEELLEVIEVDVDSNECMSVSEQKSNTHKRMLADNKTFHINFH